jgi:signal peptidase II
VKRYFKIFIIFIILVTLDIISKYWVYRNVAKMSFLYPFYPFGGIGIFKVFGISFSINLVENTGAAWGLFDKYPLILFFIRVVIVLALIGYLLIFNRDRKKDLPLALIISGAIGNILDFIFYKKVIDMFHFNFWGYSYPVFNLADSMITIGIVWLFFTFLKRQMRAN